MRPLFGSGWKMNFTSTEAHRYFDTLLPLVDDIYDRDLFVLPPFTSLWVARECLRGSRVAWGAQDVHPEDAGAHTGDISAPMLADLGCSYVEVGHAERRRDHHETNEAISAKVDAVLRWQMTPIICVGEERRLPLVDAVEVISQQLQVVGSRDLSQIVIAYEPVWAIGSGFRAAGPSWVGDVHAAIHEWLVANGKPGTEARVIYGGSVDPRSASTLLERPGVNGLFIGRSSLDPAVFAEIVRAPLAAYEVG